MADTEDAALVEKRIEAIRQQLIHAWKAAETYALYIEPEVFWRRGGPPRRFDVQAPENR